MTGDQMRKIREEMGLSLAQFGSLLGYAGNWNTMDVLINRYETGQKPIPLHIGRLVWLINAAYQGRVVPVHHCTGLPVFPRYLRHKAIE